MCLLKGKRERREKEKRGERGGKRGKGKGGKGKRKEKKAGEKSEGGFGGTAPKFPPGGAEGGGGLDRSLATQGLLLSLHYSPNYQSHRPPPPVSQNLALFSPIICLLPAPTI